MSIHRAAQWILTNGVPFTRILIFTDSQTAIKSLSDVANATNLAQTDHRTEILPRYQPILDQREVLPSMDRRRTNQLLGLGRNFISIRVVMLTSGKDEETIHFLCQCPSLARCRYRLFGSPAVVHLTKLSSIDVKDIALFIKLFGWFFS